MQRKTQDDRWCTCCGGYNHEPKGTSHYTNFSIQFKWWDPTPLLHVCTSPLVEGCTHWCHVSFLLIMGVLMISDVKEGSWKEQKRVKVWKGYIKPKKSKIETMDGEK